MFQLGCEGRIEQKKYYLLFEGRIETKPKNLVIVTPEMSGCECRVCVAIVVVLVPSISRQQLQLTNFLWDNERVGQVKKP